MMHCLRILKNTDFVLKLLYSMLNHIVNRISLQQFDYEMERVVIPDDSIFLEIGYCCHPAFLYAHIQLEQATKLRLSHFQEEKHPFIYDTLGNKKT